MAIESLEDVRVFRQIVASGGITAAAKALHQHKNRVSQRLAALEQSLGVQLAQRTTRAVRLTEEGERFYEHTTELLEIAERAELSVAQGPSLEGTVHLGLRSALAGVGLGAEIAKLLHAAPKLYLKVSILDENERVLEEGFDLAVQVGPLRDSSFVATRLPSPHYVMAATPGYLDGNGRPRTPHDLVKHQCLRRRSRTPEMTWSLVNRQGRKVDAKLAGTFECSDAQLQSEVLYAGLGVGLRPEPEVRRAAQQGMLERVLPAWSHAPLSVWVVSPKGRQKLPRVAAVIELLRRIVARLA